MLLERRIDLNFLESTMYKQNPRIDPPRNNLEGGAYIKLQPRVKTKNLRSTTYKKVAISSYAQVERHELSAQLLQRMWLFLAPLKCKITNFPLNYLQKIRYTEPPPVIEH